MSGRSCRRCAGDATGCRQRNSLRPWSPACSANWPANSREPASPSASTTMSRTPASPTTQASISSPPTRCARCSSGSARTALSAPTKTPSRSSAASRTCSRRATSSTTPKSLDRRPFRICGSAPTRSGRRIWCGERTSSAATTNGSCRRSTCWTAPRRARRCCSTAPVRPTACGTACPTRCSSRSSTNTSGCMSSTRVPSPARSGWPAGSTLFCRPAFSPSPVCCPATRRSPG